LIALLNRLLPSTSSTSAGWIAARTASRSVGAVMRAQ